MSVSSPIPHTLTPATPATSPWAAGGGAGDVSSLKGQGRRHVKEGGRWADPLVQSGLAQPSSA
eukprot:5404390-Pyramimonas_sp.AAC.1